MPSYRRKMIDDETFPYITRGYDDHAVLSDGTTRQLGELPMSDEDMYIITRLCHHLKGAMPWRSRLDQVASLMGAELQQEGEADENMRERLRLLEAASG